MTTTTVATPTDLFTAAGPGLPAEAFAERMLAASLGTLEIFAVYFGDRLGWYRALHEQGPLTSTELAHATGTAERYAREWLEQQAVNGYVSVEEPAHGGLLDGPDTAPHRRYGLPAGHAEVLLDGDSLAHLGPLARMFAAAGAHLDDIVEAYRTGGGVSWQQLGAERARGSGRDEPPAVPARAGAAGAARRRGPRRAAARRRPGGRRRLRRGVVLDRDRRRATPASPWTATTSTSRRSRPRGGTPRPATSWTG